MDDNRFVNENLIWLTIVLCVGFLAGILIGGLVLSLPGALLGAALGPMVVYRALKIRPPLPRSRTIDNSDHPTKRAHNRATTDAYTLAPYRRHGR